MENEFETNEIDGIGGVRARKGTSTSELAGAASYWNKRALAAESYLSSKWRDGFLTGAVAIALIGAACYLTAYLHNKKGETSAKENSEQGQKGRQESQEKGRSGGVQSKETL